jgi:hypothetical protein
MMNKSPKPIEITSSTENQNDDLTTIKGIGPVRQKWLQDSFGVHSFDGLAALSVDEIESQLKADGLIAARSSIEEWITSAQEMSAVTPSPNQKAPKAPHEQTIEALTDNNYDWQSTGMFIVHLQVRRAVAGQSDQRLTIQHVPVAENGTWQDDLEAPTVIAGGQLYPWILDRAGYRMPVEKDARVRVAPSERKYTVDLDVSTLHIHQQVRDDQMAELGISGGALPDQIASERPVKLEVLFGLSGESAVEMTKKRFDYRVRCFGHNRLTGERSRIGGTIVGKLEAEQLSYEAMVEGVSFAPGIYRLSTVVELLSPRPVLGSLDIPMVQVV